LSSAGPSSGARFCHSLTSVTLPDKSGVDRAGRRPRRARRIRHLPGGLRPGRL